MEDETLFTERQVFKLYGFTTAWQRRVRRERRGPRFLKIGKLVRYRKADIDAFLAAHAIEPVPASERRSLPTKALNPNIAAGFGRRGKDA